MSRSQESLRKRAARLGAATLLSLGLVAVAGGPARAQGAAGSTATAKSSSKSAAPAADKSPVTDNIKQLGREASDPGTLQRIKAHEQELEKKVERKRESQRKDHGTAKPADAVDLAKNLDKPSASAGATAKPDVKTGAKSKAAASPPGAPPAPPAPPVAATKPAPAH
jgi:hypothetical protein